MRPLRFSPALLLVSAAWPALTAPRTAAELGRSVLAAGLDASECYRVRDLEISEQDARYYFTDGYLIFGRPVEGAPLTAVFSAEVDGGDAEVLLLPPDRAERKSLATYTGSPNLDEHFDQAVLIFTETDARAMRDRVRAGAARNFPDIGALMAEQWSRTVANVESSYESRIVLDLLNPGPVAGFFEAVIHGRKLGNFDVIYDARSPENVMAGQIATRNGAAYWDTWFSYASGPARSAPAPPPEEEILTYQIDASLDAALVLHCSTTIRFKATAASSHAVPFDLSGQMRATSATMDGAPVEVYERDSLRAGLVQNTGNELLLVIPPKPLDPGSEHTVRIQHEGKVVLDAGNRVYYVSARGTWYPGRGLQFANYDVTWRYPASLDLIAAGRIVEDRRDGDTRIMRRVPEGRVRLLGLNVGEFERKAVERNGIEVEAYANRRLEEALRPRERQPVPDPAIIAPRRRNRAQFPDENIAPPPAPSPANRLSDIAEEITDEIGFYRERFGDPPLHLIEATPLPGRFGQGFAGIIYLPTVTYLRPEDTRTPSPVSMETQELYRTLLRAHEAAHQWWGNIVGVGSYHHEWLMEALACYAGLMYMESRYGPKAPELILDQYRRWLLAKGPDGAPAESEGPVVQGRRLDSSNNPVAWASVIYGKGTWIIQMLRRRMGDERFLSMLAELRKRYQWKTIDTEQFRALCAEFLPPHASDPKLETFFDEWVYGTGIPVLKLSYSVKGRPGAYKMTGQVTQSEVPDDFTITVPIEIQTGRGPKTIEVRTGSGPATFSIAVASMNAKAVLDPHWSVLRK